jgi:hypothetical protein
MLMRLHQSPEASTYLGFIYIICFSERVIAFKRYVCSHLALCLLATLLHYMHHLPILANESLRLLCCETSWFLEYWSKTVLPTDKWPIDRWTKQYLDDTALRLVIWSTFARWTSLFFNWMCFKKKYFDQIVFGQKAWSEYYKTFVAGNLLIFIIS